MISAFASRWRALVADRCQTPGEEIANSLTAAVGVAGAIGGGFLLLHAANGADSLWITFGAAVFAASLLGLYLCSTIYHALPEGTRLKERFRLLDHAAILVLIAGTYTPFALGPVRDSGGWWLFAIVWTLAGTGILLQYLALPVFRAVSLWLYLAMGWIIVAFLPAFLNNLPPSAFLWLAAGGVAYTGGVVFYVARQVRFFHGVWHVFVLIGSACHFHAVLRFAV